MNIERNIFLTEVLGQCWHEYNRPAFLGDQCIKCKNVFLGTSNAAQLDFSSWEGFGKLWEWIQIQFIINIGTGKKDFPMIQDIMRINEFGHNLSLVNPDKFADAVYEYLKDKP